MTINPASWPVQIWLGIATLMTATAAAIISFLNFKNFGKTKIAEFRAKWIEDLRQDISKLYSLYYEATLVRRSIRNAKYLDKKEKGRERLREIYIEMAALKKRVLLRLKPNSDNPDERALEEMLRTFKVSASSKKSNIRRRKEMVEVTRKILKTEWNRVRSELKIENDHRRLY